MPGERRKQLFEEFTQEEFREQVSSTTVRETGTATTVTGTSQKVLELPIASGEQLRLFSYPWFQADGNATRARLRVVASTSGFASVVDRDYLDSPGRVPPQGGTWADPYLTVGMHADGSLTFLADALSSGAQASIDRVSVSPRGARLQRLDEGRL